MKSQKQIEKEIEERDQAIEFLKQKYEEDTGKKLELPISSTNFLCTCYGSKLR